MNPINNRKELFQKVGVQFQEVNYQNEITVGELCEETSSLYNDSEDWHKLLTQFGISDKIKSAVKNLSGGQRQRLFIVLALIPKPQVVFLDELTTGLDTKARRDVWTILKNLKQKGLTIFMTSHFMDEVEELCDEICILKQGRTVFYGTVADAINSSPCDNFEDAYLWYAEEEEQACIGKSGNATEYIHENGGNYETL
jgi:ABC-2 type transport system ATP-binding protein